MNKRLAKILIILPVIAILISTGCYEPYESPVTSESNRFEDKYPVSEYEYKIFHLDGYHSYLYLTNKFTISEQDNIYIYDYILFRPKQLDTNYREIDRGILAILPMKNCSIYQRHN